MGQRGGWQVRQMANEGDCTWVKRMSSFEMGVAMGNIMCASAHCLNE